MSFHARGSAWRQNVGDIAHQGVVLTRLSHTLAAVHELQGEVREFVRATLVHSRYDQDVGLLEAIRKDCSVLFASALADLDREIAQLRAKPAVSRLRLAPSAEPAIPAISAEAKRELGTAMILSWDWPGSQKLLDAWNKLNAPARSRKRPKKKKSKSRG